MKNLSEIEPWFEEYVTECKNDISITIDEIIGAMFCPEPTATSGLLRCYKKRYNKSEHLWNAIMENESLKNVVFDDIRIGGIQYTSNYSNLRKKEFRNS